MQSPQTPVQLYSRGALLQSQVLFAHWSLPGAILFWIHNLQEAQALLSGTMTTWHGSLSSGLAGGDKVQCLIKHPAILRLYESHGLTCQNRLADWSGVVDNQPENCGLKFWEVVCSWCALMWSVVHLQNRSHIILRAQRTMTRRLLQFGGVYALIKISWK